MTILELDALTRRTVTFRVVAVPVTKGSVRAFVPPGTSRAVLTSTSTGLKAWEALIRAAATPVIATLAPRAVGVVVGVEFVLPRPKAHPKTREREHTTKPDLDKLARAVLDALTGIAYADDAQVCALTCRKRYAWISEQPGALVTVGPLASEVL
jgi:Holliday junction resolvase RusA-like endonuclease